MTSETKRTIAAAGLGVGLLAAVFVVVMCAMLTVTHLQLKRADPLNNATLTQLREQYAAGKRSDAMKADIRQLDLLARKAFFTSQTQIRTGGVLAVIAAGVMLLGFGVYQLACAHVPPPSGRGCEGMFWIAVQRSRMWIAGGTVVLVAVAVVMGISTPTALDAGMRSAGRGMPREPCAGGAVRNEPDPEGGDADVAVAGDDAPPASPASGHVAPLESPSRAETTDVSVFPEGFAENAPVFRGANGSGLTGFENVPTQWDASTGENMPWKVSLPLRAWASPVVWEDRVITLGADRERRVVYCRDAATGAEVWTVDVPTHADATADYETDTLDDRWNTLVYAGATPAVNGEQVFALFSDGQLVALDLSTGDVLWHIVPAKTGSNTYGVDNSLLIYKNSVIVAFEGDERFIARYDAVTGGELWKTERTTPSWASPLLAQRRDGSYLVVLPSDPDVTAWDPETGEERWRTAVFEGDIEYAIGPSPVQVDDVVCVNMKNCGIYGLYLSDGSIAWSLDELPDGAGFHDGASMTTDGMHVYQLYEYMLTCVDASTGDVVKQNEVDAYGGYASALVNDGMLYLLSDNVVLVLDADPAGDFEQVGKGVMEEYSDATPAIVEGRVYIRSDESLYCFGQE